MLFERLLFALLRLFGLRTRRRVRVRVAAGIKLI
jgi:hypothetical protein